MFTPASISSILGYDYPLCRNLPDSLYMFRNGIAVIFKVSFEIVCIFQKCMLAKLDIATLCAQFSSALRTHNPQRRGSDNYSGCYVKSRTNLQVCFAFTFIFSNELINVILTAVYYVS